MLARGVKPATMEKQKARLICQAAVSELRIERSFARILNIPYLFQRGIIIENYTDCLYKK